MTRNLYAFDVTANLARRTKCPERRRVARWCKLHCILRLKLLLYGHGLTECDQDLSQYYKSYKSALECLKGNKRFYSAHKQNVKPKKLTGTLSTGCEKRWSLPTQWRPNPGITVLCSAANGQICKLYLPIHAIKIA